MAKNKQAPSVLACERKLNPSDAQFFAVSWETRQKPTTLTAIKLREKSVRGTISNRLKAKDQDPAKLDAAIENPNLQTVDVATLPAEADTLKAMFTLSILGGVGVPSACNDADYQAGLIKIVKDYVSDHGFHELAQRYAYNIANARFLWRNRVGAEQVEVTIENREHGKTQRLWTFDSLRLPLRTFPSPEAANKDLIELAEFIASVLSAKTGPLLLQVVAFARLGAGQEVYPSQELILDKSSKKSKTLYSVQDVAGMHSQKIGNALRTIDTWHSDVVNVGPIAIEPYGSVTTLGKAYRRPNDKLDFYTLLDDWVLEGKVPPSEQQHFVMATLVRGGVFSKSGKE